MSIKNKLKKYSEFLLPLSFSFLIIAIYLLINDFDFRDSLLINDLESQYVGLMQYLKNVFNGKESIFYSFSKGLGGNMFSTIAYYLTSPLNLLVIFFDNVNIAVALGMVLRFCFCNLTSYIYFKYKYKTTKLNTLIFSTIYAFSGFIINYHFNIMWNDILILLPLIILQLDKLINNEKSPFLIIFLSLSLIISFYLSYMIIIFIFIYVMYRLMSEKKDFNYCKKTILRLIINIAVAFLISSFILLPTIIDIKNNIFRYDISIDLFNIDFSKIKMIISKLYIGTIDENTRFSSNEANIYFTIFGIALLIKYFLNTKIPKREKIFSLIIIFIFFISIFFDFFNIIWHGFSEPNGYNYRFTFLLIFFIINICFKQFLHNEKLDLKKLLIINAIFIIISLFMINQYSYLTAPQIIISISFFIIYTLLLNYKNKFTIVFFVLLELIINLDYSLLTRERLNYTHFVDFDYMNDICNIAQKDIKNQRVSLVSINYANDPFTCNIKDVSMTMSTNNKRYYEFMSNIGYSVTYSTLMQNMDMSPFINSILGISKIIDTKENLNQYDSLWVKPIQKDDYFNLLYIYNNYNALQVGYIIEENDINYNNNVFENQNMLAKKMSGLNLNIFEPIQLNKVDNFTYNFSTNKDETSVYFYNYFPIPINYSQYIWLFVNDKSITDIQSFNKGIRKINVYPNANNKLKLKIINDGYKTYINPLLYRFNIENYQTVIDKLKEKQLNVELFEKNKLKGKIYLDKKESIMLSIPYENGWIVKVNDKVINYNKVYDAFIGIDLEAGENNISMIFIPPGFIIGSILSIIGIILTIFYTKEKRL